MSKTKVPYFQAIYNSRWFGRRWGSTVFRLAFGNASKLPKEGLLNSVIVSDDGKLSVDLFLAMQPKFPATYFHRVMVTCPNCFETIPAGRIHQHTCEGA